MSKCWYCNNELTTGDNPKHFGICNKCYDEMFKSGDTIIRSFTNKIADLETKLAEKEKEIFLYKNVIKEKPETATEMCELLRPYELKLRENEMYKDRFKNLYNHYNQDKISFAVEQLRLLKSQIIEKRRLYKGKFSEFSNGINDALYCVEEDIDDLVAELTHQHEDKGE